MNHDQQVSTLKSALNNRAARYSVKLSNCGNPDYRQDGGSKLPGTVCGWARVATLRECSQLCRLYIAFYDLGGGNWDGGEITDTTTGLVIGRVSANGRIWDDKGQEVNTEDGPAVHLVAEVFGCTPNQARSQYARNASSLRQMAERADDYGYTREQLIAKAEQFERKAGA